MNSSKTSNYIYWVTFVAINGGFLFGLNMAGISGAISFLKEQFALSDLSLGFTVSSIMLGCLIGSWFAGGFSDKYGRKKALIVAAILFIVSALGCALSQSTIVFITSRIISGLAVGAVSVLCPTYISEIAPADKRGTLVSMQQFAIVTGILLAYVFDYFLLDFNYQWRLMMGIPAVFGLFFLTFLLSSFPESPRWLFNNNKEEKAKKILSNIFGSDYAESELKSMKDSTNQNETNSAKLSDLFNGRIFKVLVIGTFLAIFSQITGINAVINYAPTIFQKIGFGGGSALIQSIFIGIICLASTFIAIWLIDLKGRKVLLLFGSVGMTLGLAYLTYSFMFPNNKSLGILISILGYVAFYSASMAPVMWVVNSELFPNLYRGIAMSFATAVSWIFTILTVQFFPYMLNQLGGHLTFGFFGAFSLLSLLFVLKYIPETKGKSLEEIEKEMLSDKVSSNN
ncbi:sugar porter family MFS transporter [Marinilabilia rubra]|uniref:MFS transporter n=1 Tax=Marinilabilia rubra TaxID=2162893 RepID=A0A2U2BC05_9BACT|nr:sugar porter family MFS transporter [Marinilabilia rubra]PWE00599.1 MFS transporter [Marinilabilia rubra]